MTLNRSIFLCFVLMTLIGCGATPGRIGQTIPPPSAELENLAELLKTAEQQSYQLYAPQTFKTTRDLYQSALKQANSNPAKAKETVEKGLRLVVQLEENGNRIKTQLANIDSARNNALAAGANNFLSDEFADADENLSDFSLRMEKNPDVKPGKATEELVQTYRKIELRSLKLSVLGRADASLNLANERDLADYAPKTMRLAEEEYLLGTSVLNADRTQTEKASAHAANVIRHIEHAEVLAERIKQLQESEATLEDILLWHEDQLATAAGTLGTEPSFEKGFAGLISATKSGIESLQADNSALQNEIILAKEREARLREQKQQDLSVLRQDLEQKMLTAQLESDAERRRLADNRRRFSYVQELFAKEEADVYQQGRNVLIRAHGFSFAPGSSEVSEDNIALINKLIDAAEAFPDASFEVSGHTDSLGNRTINQRLSEQRARAVADFLINAGEIAAKNVSSLGHGASKPVATNDTPGGRSANRRVEVLIINPQSEF